MSTRNLLNIALNGVIFATALILITRSHAATPNMVDANGNPIRIASGECLQNLSSVTTGVCLDPELITAVKAALAAKPELKAGNLKVTSKDGDVTLSGDVDTGNQLYQIATTAQKVKGVKSVFPDVNVKQ